MKMLSEIEEKNINYFITTNYVGSSRYFVIPKLETPRLIIPLKSFKFFYSALYFHNTASIKNRIIKLFLPVFIPLIKIYKKKYVSISNSFSEELKDLFNTLNINNVEEITIYVGTPKSINRKLTILLMNRDGFGIGVIKYPICNKSYNFILNEYETLKKLNSFCLSSIYLPKSELINTKDNLILFQENIFNSTKQLKNKLNEKIIDASIELGIKTIQHDIKIFKEKLLEKIKDYDEIYKKYRGDVEKKLNTFIQMDIPIVLLHGDFVLYNMQTDGEKLYLIDWEYSRMGLPLFDLFHFIFQGKYKIEKMNVINCLKEVFSKNNLTFYKIYLKNLGLYDDIIDSLFFIYLIDGLLFDIKIKPGIKLIESHFYKALNFFRN